MEIMQMNILKNNDRNIDGELKQLLENAQAELQDAVQQQLGMIFKFVACDGDFVHTLAYGKLLYKIGFTPETLIGKKLGEVLPIQEVQRKIPYYQRAWAGEERVTYEGVLNGVHYMASLRPIFKEGKVVEVIASCVDITERVESEKRFQKMAEYSLTGVVIYNEERIIYTNPAACAILREDITNQPMEESLQGSAPHFQNQLRLAKESEKHFTTFEERLLLHDGTMIDVEISMTPIHYDGSPAIIVSFSDETKRRDAERTFEKAAKELKDVNFALNESSIVAITDRRGRIQFTNDKFCEVSKYTKEELIGQNHRLLNSGHHPKSFFKNMWKTIGSGETWRGEIRNRAKDGSFYWVHTTIVPFLNDEGIPYQYIAIRTDITERKNAEEALRISEEKLTYLAFHDPLTDLPNRRFYLKKLDELLKKFPNEKLAVVYMDMDHFKVINDLFGHNEGDAVLKKFAKVVRKSLPNEVFFARQGGDEFTMIMPNLAEEEEAIQYVEKILAALQQPVHNQHALTASIGISFYPKNGSTKDELMKFADKALYEAKRAGKNNYKIYDAEMM